MFTVTEFKLIASEKVTEILSLIVTPVWLSVGDIDETVGAVASSKNEFTFNVLLAFPAESVTVIVQFEYIQTVQSQLLTLLEMQVAH